jgi:uncharacterized protein YfkK (UPF0435 family)
MGVLSAAAVLWPSLIFAAPEGAGLALSERAASDLPAQSGPAESTRGEHANSIKSAVSNLNETIDKLVDLKDKTTSTKSKEDKAELEKQSKIEAFNEVLKLSFAEIGEIENKLNALSDKNLKKEEIATKNQFLKELGEYRRYFQNIENDVKSGLSVEELKALAEDLKFWRKQYAEDLQSIFDFLLIHQSKSLFSVAKNRWDKIGDDLIKIKKLGLPINNLQLLLNKAKKNLDEANLLNIRAHEEFFATSTESSLANINPIRVNLQKSLINIKGAYQLFFEMNNVVKIVIKQN